MLFTLEEVHCVGACGMAPVVMINDRAHGKLTPDKAVAVVAPSERGIRGCRVASASGATRPPPGG